MEASPQSAGVVSFRMRPLACERCVFWPGMPGAVTTCSEGVVAPEGKLFAGLLGKSLRFAPDLCCESVAVVVVVVVVVVLAVVVVVVVGVVVVVVVVFCCCNCSRCCRC